MKEGIFYANTTFHRKFPIKLLYGGGGEEVKGLKKWEWKVMV
jgi:hypothetical protein